MIVVSDTSPLNYLILLDCVDVLPKLFKELIAPTSVVNELRHPKAPDKVRNWADQPPSWLRVQSPQPYTSIHGLHAGENDAIALAVEIQSARLLVDEKAATRIAVGMGLRVISTLTVLGAAAEISLIELEPVIEQLRQTNFRVPAELLDNMIQEHRSRRPKKST